MKKFIVTSTVLAMTAAFILTGCSSNKPLETVDKELASMAESKLEITTDEDYEVINPNIEDDSTVKKTVLDLDINNVAGSSAKELISQASFTHDNETLKAINGELYKGLSDESSEMFKQWVEDYKSKAGARAIVAYLKDHLEDEDQLAVAEGYDNIPDKLDLIASDLRLYDKGENTFAANYISSAKNALGVRDGVDYEQYFDQYNLTREDLQKYVDDYDALGTGFNDEELRNKQAELTVKFIKEKLLPNIKINPHWHETHI